MVRDKREELKEEIRVVREILAQQDKMAEVGYSKLLDAEQDITIPAHKQHLIEQKRSQLVEHLERLEEDLDLLERQKDACEFKKDVELYRENKTSEEEDEGGG